MELNYDQQGDAAFVYVSGPLTPGSIGGTKQLDQDRLIRFDREDRILAYEFLGVRRFGVRVDDLEHRDELRAIFRDAGIPERDWSAPLDRVRRRVMRREPRERASTS